MTVKEVSALTGVSVRTLQYYDEIGLLPPARRTETGYRVYEEAQLERLGQILMYRELGFSLEEIARILSAPDYDRERALRQQAELLTMKKEHLERLLELIREMLQAGERQMDFKVLDTRAMDEYAKQAKEQWGRTDAYREYERKSAGRSADTEKDLAQGMMAIFAEMAQVRGSGPASAQAKALTGKLQAYISEHYFHCTPQILRGLGQMYEGGSAYTENIDAQCGEGTAQFTAEAIEAYCAEKV